MKKQTSFAIDDVIEIVMKTLFVFVVIFFYLILLVMPIVLIFMGLHEFYVVNRLANEGVETSAVVKTCDLYNSNRHMDPDACEVDLSFIAEVIDAETGQQIERPITATSRIYQCYRCITIGHGVFITYLPSEPTTFRVNRSMQTYPPLLMAGFGFLFFFVLAIRKPENRRFVMPNRDSLASFFKLSRYR